MKVSNITNINNNSRFIERTNNIFFPPYDCVSFGAMKKNEFDGTDLLVVNKFSAPIEMFNNNEDFQLWCRCKSDEIMQNKYKARNFFASIKRKVILNKWYKYI